MSSNSPKFSCAACGKEFRWKPEIAGRKAKCKCGQTLTVPAAPPAPAAVQTAPPPPPPAPAPATPACPECGADLPANAVLCVNCGYNLKTGQKIAGVAL